MGHAPIELGAQVAAGVAHDRIVVAERRREWIEFRRRALVRRVRLAGLDAAPGRFQAEEAVAGAECRTFRRRGRNLDQRFELGDRGPARVAVWPQIVTRANTEIGQVARYPELGALVEHAGIEDVAGQIDMAVERHCGVVDQRIAGGLAIDRRSAHHDHRMLRRRRRRDSSVLHGIALGR